MVYQFESPLFVLFQIIFSCPILPRGCVIDDSQSEFRYWGCRTPRCFKASVSNLCKINSCLKKDLVFGVFRNLGPKTKFLWSEQFSLWASRPRLSIHFYKQKTLFSLIHQSINTCKLVFLIIFVAFFHIGVTSLIKSS